MADVFISYSKEESEPTVALARDLEQRGYSTWWDSSLYPGEKFRERIRTEIAKARAVIVVWTKGSVHSDWVIAEAELARKQNKLITVRTPELDPEEIPPPFSALHTELVSDREKIYSTLSRFNVFPPFGGDEQSAPAKRFHPRMLLRLVTWKNLAFLFAATSLVLLGVLLLTNAQSINWFVTSLLSESTQGVTLKGGQYVFPNEGFMIFLTFVYATASFALLSTFLLVRYRDRTSRDELNGLRQDLDDAVRCANNIAGYINPFSADRDAPNFDILNVSIRHLINPDGDTKVDAVFELDCVTKPAHTWSYWIEADPESNDMKYLRQLNFQAVDMSTGQKLDWLQTHNTAKKKILAIFFPELKPGTRKTLRITYSWSGYMRKLIDLRATNFEWRYVSRNPSRRARFRMEWIFDRSYAPLRCRIVGLPSPTALLRLEEYNHSFAWIYEDPAAELKSKYAVEFELSKNNTL